MGLRMPGSRGCPRWFRRWTHDIEGTGKVDSMTTAAERLLAPGPEEQQLAERAGTWNVVATMWPTPGAERSPPAA